jgi:hypothetical protein
LPEVEAESAAGEVTWVELLSGQDLRFKAAAAAGEYEVMPLYRIGEQRYSIYWRTHPSKSRA